MTSRVERVRAFAELVATHEQVYSALLQIMTEAERKTAGGVDWSTFSMRMRHLQQRVATMVDRTQLLILEHGARDVVDVPTRTPTARTAVPRTAERTRLLAG